MENDRVAAGGRRPDPEVQAGRALRRLRLARSWSQEEVAVRMTAYGYDFHQTMIAKIEAAQRPLRVRELADFAALYGVEVQELVYPPTVSLSETDQEIVEVTARRDMLKAQAAKARHQLDAAREAMRDAQQAYEVSAAEVVVLEGRLASLLAERQRLIGWESSEGSSAEGVDRAGRDVLEPKGTSTASAAGGPTVIRILLGTQLRRLREASGITVADAAKVIRASSSKMLRLELGRVGLKEPDIADLLAFYGVTDEAEYQALWALAQGANAPGWWHDYSDVLPSWFQAYIGLEEAATQIRVYEVQFVPGLLQTEDYARAVMLLDHGGVSTKETEKETERRVRLRMARHTVLDRPDPPSLQVVMDEAVLRRQVGGPAVMHDQHKHLTAMAEQPNVTVQILPSQASGRAVDGSFSILQFAEHGLPDVVYLEQLTSALYLDNPKDVNSYERVMRRLSAQALTSRETMQFLRQLLKQPLST